MSEFQQPALRAWGVTPERTLLLVVFALLIVQATILAPIRAIADDNATMIGGACYLGLLFAQVGLLSMYVVFGSEPYWKRLIVHWSCLAACLIATLVGLALSSSSQPREIQRGRYVDLESEVLAFACSLPLTLLLLQLPLWIARWFAGWRFQSPDESVSASDPGAETKLKPDAKLAIHDLFSITAVVAVTLGAAQFMPQSAYLGPVLIWLTFLILGSLGGGVSALCVLPPMAIFSDRRSLTSCWCWTLGYALAAEVFIGLPLLAIVGERQGVMFFAQSLLVLTLEIGIAAGLTMLRLHGVSIVRGNR